MIPENEAIISRRWPELISWLVGAPEARVELEDSAPDPALRVNGIQLASAYAPAAEAEFQANLIPPGAGNATVYGLAQGNLPRVLLARSEIKELRVVLLSRAAVKTALTFVELDDWLDDPRVELVVATDQTELECPFVAAPAALRLADEQAWRLRDLVVLELSTPFIRRRLEETNGEVEANIAANRSLLSVDDDVARLFSTLDGRPVWIAAAGPTLSDHYDRLRSAESPLIAVDAALQPLLAAGVVPDFVVSIEKNESALERIMKVPADKLANCGLVYFPSSPHGILTNWPGKRLVAYGRSTSFASLRTKYPRGSLWCSGSVIHPAIDLAVKMGAGRVELFGADFATPRGRSHVEGMAFVKDVVADPSAPSVLNGRGEAISSLRNLIGYLRDLEIYLEQHPEVDFVNASRDGARIRGTRYAEESHAA